MPDGLFPASSLSPPLDASPSSVATSVPGSTGGGGPPPPKKTKAKSCRECIRLKLKCSRAPWPCTKCVERGVHGLCPGSELSTRPYKSNREGSGVSKQSPTDHPGLSSSGYSSILKQESPQHVPAAHRPASTSFASSSSAAASHPAKRVRIGDSPPRYSSGNGGSATSPSAPAPSSQSRSHLTDPFDGNRDDAVHTTAAPDRTRSNAESLSERGTLTFEKSGKSNYYGPGSHSFLLAHSTEDGMYSRAASPSGDHTSNEDSGDEAGRLSGVEPTSRRRKDTVTSVISPADSLTLLANSATSAETLRQRILDNPASFLAIPGVMPPYGLSTLVKQLSAHLPTRAEAKRAFRVYRRNVCWMYSPISALDRLWSDFYQDEQTAGPSMRPRLHPHRLALVFSVLSLGTLFDVRPSSGRKDRRAERYYHSAWAALQLSNPGDSNTVENVQTIHLVGQYLCNRKNGRNADSFFPLVGTAVRNAIALGLHREGRAWNLPQDELEERRRLFWELYASDCFRSLAYGRPASIQDAHVDASFPTKRKSEGLSDVFHTVKYQVVRLLNRILDVCQRPNVPYDTVLEFDRALRELWAVLPPELNPVPTSSHVGEGLHLDRIAALEGEDDRDDDSSYRQLHQFLQGHTIVANINQSLLHLHRPWFVRALQQDDKHDHGSGTASPAGMPSGKASMSSSGTGPSGASSTMSGSSRDAFDSRYARSIIGVSEASRSLIHTAQAVLDVVPSLGKQWNYFWQHCFNSAVCQCLQILHSPSSITTFGAWDDVRRALSILRKARPDKDDVIWAGKIDLLERLHSKADTKLKSRHANNGLSDGSSRRESVARKTADEQEQQLRLVGVTSRLDHRDKEEFNRPTPASAGGGKWNKNASSESEPWRVKSAAGKEAVTPTPSAFAATGAAPGMAALDPFRPWEDHTQALSVLQPSLPASYGSSSGPEDFGSQHHHQHHTSSDFSIPALSQSLMDSLFDTTSFSSMATPASLQGTGGGAGAGNMGPPGDMGATPITPGHQHPHPSMAGESSNLLASHEGAQMDWLLRELLQGGTEPEAHFWQTMFDGSG